MTLIIPCNVISNLNIVIIPIWNEFQTLLEVECDAGVVSDSDCDRNKEKGGVEYSSEENTAVDDFLVISKPVSQETNQGRGEKYAEG